MILLILEVHKNRISVRRNGGDFPYSPVSMENIVIRVEYDISFEIGDTNFNRLSVISDFGHFEKIFQKGMIRIFRLISADEFVSCFVRRSLVLENFL